MVRPEDGHGYTLLDLSASPQCDAVVLATTTHSHQRGCISVSPRLREIARSPPCCTRRRDMVEKHLDKEMAAAEGNPHDKALAL